MSKLLKKISNHDEEYARLVYKKNIAIIGPAKSTMYEENGKYIDSFDLVVRVNKGAQIVKNNKNFVGSRTDILYNSLDLNPLSGGNLNKKDVVSDSIKQICCPYPLRERTFNDNIFIPLNNEVSIFENKKIRFIKEEIYTKVKETTNSRLNTGFGAILDLLSFEISSLYVSGIDFYRSVYHEQYNAERDWGTDYRKIEDDLEFKKYDDSDHHNPDRQYLYFKKLLEENKNVIMLDNFMSKIITDPRYDKWETIPR